MKELTHAETIANIVREKSVEILHEVGFCVPDQDLLPKLQTAGFQFDLESEMVKIQPELMESALKALQKDFVLFNRDGQVLEKFRKESCFIGAGTPVNVFDLQTGQHRSATRQDAKQIITIQDALSQVDIVRPTVTATDIGESSDLVEIAELLRCATKPNQPALLPAKVEQEIERIVKR